MKNRLSLTPFVAVTAGLLFCTAGLQAQVAEKAAARLTYSTSSDAARAALGAAVHEITNIGGAARIAPKVKQLVDADPSFAVGRALYANWSPALPAAERERELVQALEDAATASLPELLFVAAIREARAGNRAAARDLLDLVMKHAPDDPTVAWLRMQMAADLDDAVRVAAAAVERFPDHAAIHNIYAYRLNAQGRTDEALQAVEKYVKLLPDHPNPHDSYAELLQLNGRLDEAEVHYRHAVEIDPNWEVAYEGLAEIAALRGDFTAARAQLTKALPLAATPARRAALQRGIATTFLYQNELNEAKQQLAAAVQQLENNGGNAAADHRVLAFVAALQGDRTEAVRQHAASTRDVPAPIVAVADAMLNTLLGRRDEVSKALANIEAEAVRTPDGPGVQDALQVTRIVYAVANDNLDAARTAQKQLTAPLFKAYGNAFLVRPLAKAGDRAGSKAALADVEAFKGLNINAPLTRLIARR